jgi:hypothetical protein
MQIHADPQPCLKLQKNSICDIFGVSLRCFLSSSGRPSHKIWQAIHNKDIKKRRVNIFLGLLDPDPDPLVRSTDPDPDPSIIKQKQKEKP